MKMLLRSLIVIILVNIASHAQVPSNTAPPVWERYAISADGVSFMVPKMPVRQDQVDVCEQMSTSKYYVYAEGAVYEFGVYRKVPKHLGQKCYGLVTPFGRGALEKHLDEIAKLEAAVLGSKFDIEGRQANHFAAAHWTRLVISEVEKRDRWLELVVHHYPGDTPDVDRFLKSVVFSAESGKEIGHGAEAILADPRPDVSAPAPVVKKDPPPVTSGAGNGPGAGLGSGSAVPGSGPCMAPTAKCDGFRLISKPKASYTDEARNADVQGAVRLKVTLLASGGIGSVVPVTHLTHGLTENAIAAAKRLVFLPKRVNGVPVSVTVTFEYKFSIY